MRYLSLLFFIIVISNPLYAQNSDGVVYLESEVFIKNNVSFPADIATIGDRLFVKDLRQSTGNYGIKVFNAGNGEKIYEFVREGRGPGEYNRFDIRKGPGQYLLEIMDSQNRINDIYDANCLDNLSSTDNSYQCIINTVTNLASREAIILDSSFVINTGASPRGVLYTSRRENIIERLDSIPSDIESNYNNSLQAAISIGGYIEANMTRDTIAFFGKYYDQYNFYSYSRESNQFTPLTEHEYTYLPNFKVLMDTGDSSVIDPSDKTIYTHVSLSSGQNHLYVLYSGKTKNDVKESEFADWRSFSKIIHVYDWEGNLVNKLELDHRIYRIAVDWQENFLYGIHFSDNGLPFIVKADL